MACLGAWPDALPLGALVAVLPLLRAAFKPRRERRGPETWLNQLSYEGPQAELRPLGAFGAEVKGLNLACGAPEWLRGALLEHGLLLFRGQDLLQEVRFTRLGPGSACPGAPEAGRGLRVPRQGQGSREGPGDLPRLRPRSHAQRTRLLHTCATHLFPMDQA